MKRIFALVLSFAVLFSCLVLPAGAMFDPQPGLSGAGTSAYIVNTDTNIIVYDKDSTKQVSAGGLTKYMTIALLLTNYADQLDNTFQMPFAISGLRLQHQQRRYALQRDFYLPGSHVRHADPQRQRSRHGPGVYPFRRRPRELGEPDEHPVPAHRHHRQHLDGCLRH